MCFDEPHYVDDSDASDFDNDSYNVLLAVSDLFVRMMVLILSGSTRGNNALKNRLN